MAQEKVISQLNQLATVDPNADWVPVVDVSDTTASEFGTTKKALVSEFVGETGSQGEQGEPGPNEVTTSTDTDITGYLYGDGANVSGKAISTVKTELSLTKSDVGLGNVSNVDQVPLSYLDTDTSLTANSDTKVATQKATKAYSDTKLTQATADSLYAPLAKGVTNGDSHDHSGGDGAQINHTTLSNIGTNTHAEIDTHLANTSNPHTVTANQVLPSQTGNGNKFLKTDGSNVSWDDPGVSGGGISEELALAYAVVL